MITIQNKVQKILKTNYWYSDMANMGLMFLSWNAGGARLLMPELMKHLIPEMETGNFVIVSRGPWVTKGGRDSIEVLFEDGSESPFAIHLSSEQCDRMLPQTENSKQFNLSVWTSEGLMLDFPAGYRVVEHTPCLQTWNDDISVGMLDVKHQLRGNPLFSLGRISATEGAFNLLEKNSVNGLELIKRHQSGDWGDLPLQDAELNDSALRKGGRILSLYSLNNIDKIWIITERDRSETTLLLPKEY